jgi:hypothetical protein
MCKGNTTFFVSRNQIKHESVANKDRVDDSSTYKQVASDLEKRQRVVDDLLRENKSLKDELLKTNSIVNEGIKVVESVATRSSDPQPENSDCSLKSDVTV